MSKYRAVIRDTLVAGACAVLFVTFMFGMRYLNSLENKDMNFAAWQLRGAEKTE